MRRRQLHVGRDDGRLPVRIRKDQLGRDVDARLRNGDCLHEFVRRVGCDLRRRFAKRLLLRLGDRLQARDVVRAPAAGSSVVDERLRLFGEAVKHAGADDLAPLRQFFELVDALLRVVELEVALRAIAEC